MPGVCPGKGSQPGGFEKRLRCLPAHRATCGSLQRWLAKARGSPTSCPPHHPHPAPKSNQIKRNTSQASLDASSRLPHPRGFPAAAAAATTTAAAATASAAAATSGRPRRGPTPAPPATASSTAGAPASAASTAAASSTTSAAAIAVLLLGRSRSDVGRASRRPRHHVRVVQPPRAPHAGPPSTPRPAPAAIQLPGRAWRRSAPAVPPSLLRVPVARGLKVGGSGRSSHGTPCTRCRSASSASSAGADAHEGGHRLRVQGPPAAPAPGLRGAGAISVSAPAGQAR